jgi:leucyl aminopeptidase (aminopeptidase T)
MTVLEHTRNTNDTLQENLVRRADTLTSRAFAALHLYSETLDLTIGLLRHEWFPGVSDVDTPSSEELWAISDGSGLHGWLNDPSHLWVDGQRQQYERLQFNHGHVTEALAINSKALSHSLTKGADLSGLPLVISLVKQTHRDTTIRSHLVIGEYLGSCDVIIELGFPNVDGILADGSRQPVMRGGVWWFASDVVAEGAD